MRARVLLIVMLTAVAAHGAPAPAQPQDSELLSKHDARLLFRMSRDQWQERVNDAVKGGFATPYSSSPTMTGMQVKAPGGYVITQLDYSRGETKPALVQIVVTYPPGHGPSTYSEARAKQVLADTRKQMAPEFDVVGKTQRIEGGLAFSFTIREGRGPTGGAHGRR
jgi:hypothetical protein